MIEELYIKLKQIVANERVLSNETSVLTKLLYIRLKKNRKKINEIIKNSAVTRNFSSLEDSELKYLENQELITYVSVNGAVFPVLTCKGILKAECATVEDIRVNEMLRLLNDEIFPKEKDEKFTSADKLIVLLLIILNADKNSPYYINPDMEKQSWDFITDEFVFSIKQNEILSEYFNIKNIESNSKYKSAESFFKLAVNSTSTNHVEISRKSWYLNTEPTKLSWLFKQLIEGLDIEEAYKLLQILKILNDKAFMCGMVDELNDNIIVLFKHYIDNDF